MADYRFLFYRLDFTDVTLFRKYRKALGFLRGFNSPGKEAYLSGHSTVVV